RIGAFGQHPRSTGLEAGPSEQCRERHAGPFRGGDEAVRALHGRLTCPHDLPASSAGAFHEISARKVGKRLRSASEYLVGRSTMPWITRRCLIGSIFGMPA